MNKRVFGLLLCVILLAGLIPATAFAAAKAPVDISIFIVDARSVAYYNGSALDPADFGLVLVDRSGPLDHLYSFPDECIGVRFYRDPSCTILVRDGEGNPCAPTNVDAYFVKAVGLGVEHPEGPFIGESDMPVTVFVNKKSVVWPTADSTELVYDGTEKKLDLNDFDALLHTVSGDTATEVGDYRAEIALVDPYNCCWAGEDPDPRAPGTSEPFSIDWSIINQEIPYKIIEGSDQKIDLSKGGDAKFASNAPYAKFDEVLVDGKTIDDGNYTVKGSDTTKVSLTAAYLKTLSVGKHTLAIVSSDGMASTNFTVINDVPVTGDSSDPALWSLIMIGSLAAVAVCLFLRKKETER